MATAAAGETPLGYSLHVLTTNLLEQFTRNTEDDFRFLDEILAEAKKHFGRRDSIALLPKTPCMKRKRKPRSPDDFLENYLETYSPIGEKQDPPEVCSTPESKKPAIRSPLQEADENKGLDTSVRGNGKKTRGRAVKKRQPAKTSKRQQPKRGAKTSKNAVQVTDPETSVLVEVCQDEKPPQKRVTRGKKNQGKVEDANLENTPKEAMEAIAQTPKAPDSAKKLEISLIPEKDEKNNVEVSIPETPEVKPVTRMKSDKGEMNKTHKVSVSIVLASPVKTVEQPASIIEVAEVIADESKSNEPVLVVELLPVDVVPDSTEYAERGVQEVTKPANELDSASTKRRSKRRTRSTTAVRESSSRNSSRLSKKRKQESIEEQENESAVVTTSTPVQETEIQEVGSKSHKIEAIDSTSSDSDKAMVSSSVKSLEKLQSCCSTRSMRRSGSTIYTRRSSPMLSQSSKQCKKSKVRKSKSLVKSSIKLKLTVKKVMPPLTPTSTVEAFEKNESNSEDQEMSSAEDLKVDLFGAENTQEVAGGVTRNVETVEKLSDSLDSSTGMLSTSSAGAKGGPCHHDNGNNGDVFHDVPEHLDEMDGWKDESNQRPTTRASSRLKTTDSSSDQTSGTSTSSESSFSQSSPHTPPCVSPHTSPSTASDGSSSDNDKSQSSPGSNDATTPEKQSEWSTALQAKNKLTNILTISSFIKRNTPKKFDLQEKKRQLQQAMKEKAEKEKERMEQLEIQRQKRTEEQKRKREERQKRVAEQRAAQEREKEEKLKQLEEREKFISTLTEKARKKKEREEETKRKARLQKKAYFDARRKQEEDQRLQKLIEQEEEARQYRELQHRKLEFDEQERQRKILEAKRLQELREQELERERELEQQRKLKEFEDKERKAKEEKEKLEKKMKEEREKEEKERKRIVQLLKEKGEQEKRDREIRAKEERVRQERERRLRDEKRRKEELERERERLRILEENLQAEEARNKAIMDIDSYEMTPPPPPRVRSVYTAENYSIDDICSDDSTDDEDAPRKKVPGWAQGAKLKAALLNQSAGRIDIDAIFGGVAMPNLDDIFKNHKKKRFYQRTSSAHWDSPPLRSLNRGTVV